jgi:hypothetical protein
MVVQVHAAVRLPKNSSTQVRRHAVTKVAIDMASRSRKCRIAPHAASITHKSQPISTQTALVEVDTEGFAWRIPLFLNLTFTT